MGAVTKIEELERYLVGGAVRDQLLGVKDNSDRDWVVVGATPELMLSLGFKEIGKDFPVYLHPTTHEEHALARTERKSGRGYKGFIVDTSSNVTLEEDLYRRDLTINAMALTDDGQVIDPFGGKIDLENGLLRHVSEHFAEDPLRVLRVARFAGRFFRRGFIIDNSTMALMQRISDSGELHDLVAERVWQEVHTALKEDTPSVFFKVLRTCGAQQQLFPEMDGLFRDDSGESAGIIDNLDIAVEYSKDTSIRFAVIAFYIYESSNSDTTEVVRTLCNRLRVPVSMKHLSLQIVWYTRQVQRARNLSAEDIVDLIKALNGLRNPAAYNKFLDTCSVILKVDSGKTREIDLAIELLRNCREQMRAVDAKTLSEMYSDAELRKQVRRAQISMVQEQIERSMDAA